MPSRYELANAIRILSMDTVQRAKSGHPGMPMGMADIAEVVWNDFLRHSPLHPHWLDRDRFVLSNGHGSMLHYALLHLSGYALPLEELQQFRQLHSMTPGHPEYGCTPGIETTTGPLGQGIANAVGMAIGERVMADRYNRPGYRIVNHNTWCFTGDGCLMEGISHEACSLAGTLGLGKLILIYDDNTISIDGPVSGWFSDDTQARFAAYGWQVIADVDGHNPDSISSAVVLARQQETRPTLIICKTIIGFGAPNKQGTAVTHGAPLGEDEIAAARNQLGWTHEPFKIPETIYAGWDARINGHRHVAQWSKNFASYSIQYPELAAEFTRRTNAALPSGWSAHCERMISATAAKAESIPSRKASQNALEYFGPMLPELIGGSADLAASNLSLWSGSKALTRANADANYIYFGVREFAMVAISSGLALHRGFIPYSATFLIFSEYARNALRMAALMKLRSVFVFTHDSIGLGEDGPTHQAVEQAATLRLIPNMSLWRPCDAVESLVAWRFALERNDGPTSLLFSRQSLPHQPRTARQLADICRGAYILKDCDPPLSLQAIIIATGSEVALAMEATTVLATHNIGVRVVSMPSVDVFEAQDFSYKQAVIPSTVKARVAVEAGVSDGWYKYVGINGQVVGIDTFGASAPAKDVFEYFGFTVANVVAAVIRAIDGAQ